MDSIGNPWLYLVFFGIVFVMLLIDFLGFKQKSRRSTAQASTDLEYCMGHGCTLVCRRTLALSTTNGNTGDR